MATPINQRTIERWNNAKKELIEAAEKVGVDPKIMVQIAGFESAFNSNAKPISSNASKNTQTQYDGTKAISTAHGYGQFLNRTWHSILQKHGGKHEVENVKELTITDANSPKYREDTKLQANLLAELTKYNIELGEKYGGENPSANVYALHNLGEPDGPNFLKELKLNPNNTVSTVLSSAVISGNQGLYGDGSITFKEAYDRMGNYMNEAEIYVKNIYSDVPLEVPENAPSLLKVGSEHAYVKTYQEQLKAAGYEVDITGKYDQGTVDATKQLQRDNYLKVDGEAGFKVHIALNATLNQGKSNGLDKIEKDIQGKFDHLNDLISQQNSLKKDPAVLLSTEDKVFFGRDILLVSHDGDMNQLGSYLTTLGLANKNATQEEILSAITTFEQTHNITSEGANWSETLATLKVEYIAHQTTQLQTDIDGARHELAQLELDRQSSLTAQQKPLQDELLGLRGQVAKEGQEKQIGAIEVAQTQKDNVQALVGALKSDPATEQKTIDALAIAAKITLVTPVEQTLAEKEPFKSTDKASITALQDVL